MKSKTFKTETIIKKRFNVKKCKEWGGKKERKKIGQTGAAVWDFVRTSQQWCVKTADGEMFGDDDVPVFNTQG